MVKFPRIGMLVLVGLLAMAAGLALRGGGRGGSGSVQVAQFGLGGGGSPGVKALSGPLLVAGDEQYLWVEQPQEIDEKSSGGSGAIQP